MLHSVAQGLADLSEFSTQSQRVAGRKFAPLRFCVWHGVVRAQRVMKFFVLLRYLRECLHNHIRRAFHCKPKIRRFAIYLPNPPAPVRPIEPIHSEPQVGRSWQRIEQNSKPPSEASNPAKAKASQPYT